MIPAKLGPGDEVRVVLPATSLGFIPEDQRTMAAERLRELGLRVTFSRNAEVIDRFDSSPVEARVSDLYEAFSDPAVDGVLTNLGGYNSNRLLDYLDYDLIRANPKVLCGFSDITALAGAIHARTGLVTYSEPHFTARFRAVDLLADSRRARRSLEHLWAQSSTGPFLFAPPKPLCFWPRPCGADP